MVLQNGGMFAETVVREKMDTWPLAPTAHASYASKNKNNFGVNTTNDQENTEILEYFSPVHDK